MLLKRKWLIIFSAFVCIIGISITIAYASETKTSYDDVGTNDITPVASTLKSNRYTQHDDLSQIDHNPYVSLDDHELLGTDASSNLSLYVHPEHLSLRIVNEKTGYIWGSNMDHSYLEEDDPLYDANNPQTNTRQDNSPVSISYYNMGLTTIVRQNEYYYEGAFNGSHIRTDYDDKVGFLARIKMPRSGIMFDLSVYLDEQGLHVEVPFDSVKDVGNFLISTITIYRNFGFTTRDVTPGYVFIPDGIGALIRYDEAYAKNFSKRFYGPDETLGQSTLERYLMASVYGSVQGIHQNAMMVILESGAANGTLTYQSHNPNVLFNKLYTTFEYRDKYIQRLNASGTSTIELVQADKNKFDIHYIYQFLDGEDANYVGFSNQYRTYLQSEGHKLEPVIQQANIPLHLDVLAVENKSVWYGKEKIQMTSAKQLDVMTDELLQAGIDNLYATIHGWQNGGLSQTAPNYQNIDSKFGDPNILNKEGLKTYYAVAPRLGNLGSNGFSSNIVVQNQGSELIDIGNYYILNAKSALSNLENHLSKILNKGITRISLEDMYFLNSDYHQSMSRTESIDVLRDYLEVAEETIVNAPFDYLFGADVIKEIELYSSQRIVFTDTVPFLTLVLSGHKTTFGRSANFFANTKNELLRMIDYQVYPNFYMTHQSAQLLLNTNSSHIFTSQYADWKSEILSQYDYLNNALKTVIGAYVVARDVLEPGFVVNTYSNGVKIYVNYSGDDYMADGITVGRLSYEVVL